MKEWLIRLGAMASLGCFVAGLVFRTSSGNSARFFTGLGIFFLVVSMLAIFRTYGDDNDEK